MVPASTLSRVSRLDAREHLVGELLAIESPWGMVIPLKLDGRIVRTLTAIDHSL
jgi:hypothetical protein